MKVIKTLIPLLISGLVSWLVVIFSTEHVQYTGIVEDLSSWNSFFNVFGVVYAIVTGFLLVTVLNRYSALSQTLEDELNAIESIRDFLVYFRDAQREESAGMKKALARYVRSLSEEEWKQMSEPSVTVNSDTSDELYEIMRSGRVIRAEQSTDRVVLAAIVENVSEVTKLRTRRIALSNERLPPRLRILLVFMSVVIATSFVLLGVRSTAMHVFMVVVLVISVHLLYMIVEDLDHPFYGVWNVDKTPLEQLLARFEEELAMNSPDGGKGRGTILYSPVKQKPK